MRHAIPHVPVAAFVLSVVVLAMALGGCAPASDTSSDASTPQVTGAESIALGEELFQSNCARCHGEDLRGTSLGPPFLDPVYLPDHHSDDAFLLAVRNGVQAHHWSFGPMPPVPGLGNADVDHITAYVRHMQREAGLLE